ncbi:ArsR/SmtB family transcription factor [Flavobacterium sp.]|jgi:DNA-binding transcriptional ArsR family regulator|uniref:ArsR/SmtB family transcription factor n=1 Tax=Flavobacterium sp. TaxID=239 RepID=UPI0037C11922
MGITKSESFTTEQNEMANLFKAMANPARVAIIQYLLKVDSCICGDIVNELPLAQPTISQHLKELKNANIIQGTIEGKSICYCLNKEVFESIGRYFMGMYIKLDAKCC